MTPAHFLETRSPAWARMDELLKRAGRRGARSLTDDELHELTRLYPAVAIDVARARLYGLDRATQSRVNQLAIAAHGLLYRPRRSRPLQAVARFLTRDYPRLFRRLWAYMCLSAGVFVVASACTYATVRLRPATAYVFVPRGLDVHGGAGPAVSPEDVSERYRQMPRPPMASLITTNNLSVAFTAFALGIAAGLGTAYVLLINAVMLGAFLAHFTNHGLAFTVYAFLTPHGALEIFAVLVAGAAGFRLGLSLAVPGQLTRGASLRAGAREAVLLVLGTIPMFVVAGAIESFLTPSHVGGGAKIASGLLALGTCLAWLLLAGRGPATADGPP